MPLPGRLQRPAPQYPADLLRNGLPGRGTRPSHPPAAQRLIHRVTKLPPFQTLLDEYAPDVMGVLRGAVGRTDAEDCFQETFLAALRAYPKLDNGENLRGWLLTIAHRKAIDHHRANGRQPLPVADVAEIPVEDPERQTTASGARSAPCRPSNGPPSRCATAATSPTPRSPPRSAARPRRPAAACTRESSD